MSGSSIAGLKRLTLRERHDALGARFAPFAGWEMPLQYQGTVAEHQAVRDGVAVFDVSHLGRVWVGGAGADRVLRSATTFDVTSIPVGKAHYSLYCNDAGGIDDDVFVYHLPRDRWLIVHNAANAKQDLERLHNAFTGEAVDVTSDTVMLAVQGPDALPLLGAVFGDSLADIARHGCLEFNWQGSSVLFARTGYTGEDGGECIVGADRAGDLWDALMEAGAAPAGLGARDTLRLEAALPLHGNDIDHTVNPFEAGLGFAVSLEDGRPFQGREALVSLKEGPLSRRLAHLKARGRGVPRAGFPVYEPDSGEAVAVLTSGGFSPSLRLGIGMAYLPVRLARAGVRLQIDIRGRELPVEVVSRPFYRKSRQS